MGFESGCPGYLLLAVLLLVGSAWFVNGLRLKRRDLEQFASTRHATAAVRRSWSRKVLLHQSVELRVVKFYF